MGKGDLLKRIAKANRGSRPPSPLPFESSLVRFLTLYFFVLNADEMMYWVTTNNPMVEMASLNGNGRVVLLNESKAEYTGIALYNGFLYISDRNRRFALYIMNGTCIWVGPFAHSRPIFLFCQLTESGTYLLPALKLNIRNQ